MMLQRTSGHWWTGHGTARPRLVVEGGGHGLDMADFRAYTDGGFDVAQCSGPGRVGDCPTQRGERCPLVDRADVVLTTVDAGASVAEAVRTVHPDVALVVEVPREARRGEAAGTGDLDAVPEGCTALPFPSSIRGQLRTLHAAAMGPREGSSAPA